MSKKELEAKAIKQIDIAATIYTHVVDLATEIVDEKFPAHKQLIKDAFLPWVKYNREMDRHEAISGIVANILTLAAELRV